ncbi:MAG: transcriptional repressor LexA [Spirochaetes bacterium]|nr:transcriptional repressor LexA [Spirochaetota bacterium]
MKTLTSRQKEVLGFISVYIDEHAYPPTIREIAESFAVSVKGAYDHIKALEKKGVIKLGENRSRSIEIVDRARREIEEVPLIGTVAAGKPVFAVENYEGTVRVPCEMTKSRNCFALRVKGDSMKDAGIFDGDVAVIEERQVADNGDIVVAMLEDAVTLKRFFKEPGRVRLMAENPGYSPIYSQDVRILGRLRGIIRTY